MESTNSTQNVNTHTAKIKNMFSELIDHLRSDVTKIEDVQAKAMFETSAEVLIGLRKAFNDFDEKNEQAWHKS